MRKNIVSICVLALLLVTFSVFGQEDRNKGIINSALIGLEYEVKAGFNIGGTAPIPLPVEIRDITGYNPTMAVAIEGNVTKWFDQEKKWGMRIGIRLDSKGMKTNAKVKNYGMEIIGEGGERIKGNWTGYVKTNVKNTYLSFPVLATHQFNRRFSMNLGPYFAYMLEGDFPETCMMVICAKVILPVIRSFLPMEKMPLMTSRKTFAVSNGVRS